MKHEGVIRLRRLARSLSKLRNALLAIALSGLLTTASAANATPAQPPAPALVVTPPTAPDTHYTFAFDGQPSDTFWCAWDGGTFFDCGANYVYDYQDGTAHTLTYYLEQPNRTVSLTGSYVLHDLVAPVAPSIVDLDADTDSSTLGDFLTFDRNPKFNLANLEVNATVNAEIWSVTLNQLVASCEFTAVATTGDCVVSLDLPDGDYVLKVDQVDGWQNQSTQVTQAFTIDGTPADHPTLSLAAASNTGSKTDLVTTKTSPDVELTGLEIGTHLVVMFTLAGHPPHTCDFVATATSHTCTVPTLAVGHWDVTATSEDAAGNLSEAAAWVLEIAKAAVVPPSNQNPDGGDNTDEATTEPTTEPTVEPTPTSTPSPSADPNDPANNKGGKGGSGGSTNSSSKQGQPFNPLGSAEGIQDTNQVTTLALALVAALAAAGSRRGNARKTDKSAMPEQASQADAGIDSIEVELRDFDVDQEGVGDALPIFDTKFFTAIDKPSHEATMVVSKVSPVVAKIFNDGAYLRSITGVISLLAPLVGILLGVLAIGKPSQFFLPPALGVFIAISVLGIFDAFAGFIASIIYAVGALVAHTQFNALTANDLRLVIGVFIVGFGPALLASAFREFRRPAEQGVHYWWERITDFAVVPLIGYLTVASMVKTLPALAGIQLDVAAASTEFGVAIAVALIVRVSLEELAARAFPKRLNQLHPSSFPERPIWMQAVSLLARTGVFVFVSASLLGNYWQTWLGCALMMVPTILSWFADKWPNSVWLWRVLPQGIPGMITSLLIGLGSSLLVSQTLGVTPEYARMSFVLMQLPMIAFSVLGLFGRHGQPGEVRWLQRPHVAWVYRLGGVAMLGWVLLLTGVF